jgi:hypothetical protein
LVSVPVVLDTPRDLTPSQERKLRNLESDGAIVVGWDDRLWGPVFLLPAFPGGRYVIEPHGKVSGK